MLKTCSRCGIVPEDHICPYKPVRKSHYGNTNVEEFRNSRIWKNKRTEIKKRDYSLCQVCIREKYNTINKYNYNKLEVHHIIPLSEDYSKRLDNDNLITLCSYHHKMADDDLIPRSELKSYIPPSI